MGCAASNPMVVSGSSIVQDVPEMPVMSPFIVLRTKAVVEGDTNTSMWCGRAIMSKGPDPWVSQSNVIVPRSPVAVADTVPPVGIRAAWASRTDSPATSSKAARSDPVKGADATSAPLLWLNVMVDEA